MKDLHVRQEPPGGVAACTYQFRCRFNIIRVTQLDESKRSGKVVTLPKVGNETAHGRVYFLEGGGWFSASGTSAPDYGKASKGDRDPGMQRTRTDAGYRATHLFP
ncbi:MAG: hypothetical protein H5T73_09410 [Actinobacteria bacterium]|nr:hypothetical protein [Actinomycetota bacterium]